MRYLLVGFLAGLVLVSLGEAQESSNEGAASLPFVSGGTVWLKLSSGDYTVSASTGDRVLVHWRVDDLEHLKDMKKIKVRTDVSSNVLTIRTEGPTNHALFTIEIPARSDLNMRIRAGDVRINGIEGNKDIRMTAGDLNIDVRPGSYSLVHASVKFGDLNAQPLGISKDGIARSLNWTGPGTYTLNASLFAGDVTLLNGR